MGDLRDLLLLALAPSRGHSKHLGSKPACSFPLRLKTKDNSKGLFNSQKEGRGSGEGGSIDIYYGLRGYTVHGSTGHRLCRIPAPQDQSSHLHQGCFKTFLKNAMERYVFILVPKRERERTHAHLFQPTHFHELYENAHLQKSKKWRWGQEGSRTSFLHARIQSLCEAEEVAPHSLVCPSFLSLPEEGEPDAGLLSAGGCSANG